MLRACIVCVFTILALLPGCRKEGVYKGRKASEWRADLKSGDAAVRREAAHALAAIEPVPIEAIPDLAAALSDKDVGVRMAATHALWNIGPEAAPATEDLARVLSDKNARVRLGAAGALGAIGRPAKAALPALGKTLVSDPDPLVRHEAIKAVQRFRKDAIDLVPQLTKALKDKSTSVVSAAIYTLIEMGPGAKAAIPALEELVKEGDPSVRGPAGRAIRTLKGEVH